MKFILTGVLAIATIGWSVPLPPVTGSGTTGKLAIWTDGANSELGDSKIRQYGSTVAIETPNGTFHAGDFDGYGAHNYIHVGSDGSLDLQSATRISIGDTEAQSENPNAAVVNVNGRLVLPNIRDCARLGTDGDGVVVCKEFEP